VSIVFALMLEIVPLPEFATPFRPLWLAMTVLFWNITLPSQFNIGSSWIAGLCLDLISGATLGQHALAMILMSYIGIRLYKEYRLFSVLQQLLLVFSVLVVYLGIVNWIWGIGGDRPPGLSAWAPLLGSTLLWPWYHALLTRLNHHYRGSTTATRH
jgi:rod shape-determining protein MreD